MKKRSLTDIPRREPFQAPEGYLEQLPYQVQRRIQHLQSQPAVTSFGKWLLRPQLQLAMLAMAVLMVGAAVFLAHAPAPAPDPQALLEEVSDQELVRYLETSTSISMQEITSETNWQSNPVLLNALPPEDDIEAEVLQNIDTYSADEIWR